MIKIEINGQVVEAHEGDMLIDVADEARIPIPRFCYHKKLSVAANCRMCLVEVEGAPKALPACATPVTDGMKVKTNSPKARAAQKAVMEFLLINHPLDCPICDQGGECELQDVAFEYGDDVGKYSEAKRVVPDHDIGPLIATDMTRCIHCTRCVRFGQEISGLMELGAVGRSEWMEITTYVGKSITSEISGNIIDLCPVGALTSKPFRYKARAWELKAAPSIAGHDSIGSNIEVHTYHGKVMRVVPRENEEVNEVWLSDRDRFAYEGINSGERLTVPKIKTKGQWDEVEWEEALEAVVSRLKPYLNQPEQIAVIASPNATVEELYLLQKLCRALGIESLEHRLQQLDFRTDKAGFVAPYLHHSLPEVENLQQFLLIGSDLRYELPLLNLRVRKAQLAGAQVRVLNPVDYAFTFDLADKLICKPSSMLAALAGMVKAAAGDAVPSDLEGVAVTQQHQEWVEQLKQPNSTIFVGAIAQMSPEFAQFARLAALLSKYTGATLNILPQRANSVGAYAVGFVPKQGDNAAELFNGTKKVVIQLGVEPEFDSLYGAHALKLLKQAELVVNLTAFESETISAYSDILLPIATYTETAGTYINAHGEWQSFKIASDAPGDAKPAWKILRVLGNMFGVDGFEYVHADEVLKEAQQVAQLRTDASVYADLAITLDQVKSAAREIVPFLSLYSVDPIVRRSTPLQSAAGAARAVAQSALSQEAVKVCCGGECVTLPNETNEAVAKGVIVLPVAVAETLSVPVACAQVASE
jgi:NADH-quinone oxidoreductase subunit G